MTVTHANIQTVMQSDISQAYNNIHLIAALQSELEALQAKVETYYHNEIVLRGDKVLMREYCGYFGIEPTTSNI